MSTGRGSKKGNVSSKSKKGKKTDPKYGDVADGDVLPSWVEEEVAATELYSAGDDDEYPPEDS